MTSLVLILFLSVPTPAPPRPIVNATDLPVSWLVILNGCRVRYTAEVVSSAAQGGRVELDHSDDRLTVAAEAEADAGDIIFVEGTLRFIRHPATIVGATRFPGFSEVRITR